MFAELCSWENLLLAYRKAAKGKRGHANVATFEYRLEDRLLELRDELLSGSYRPRGYTNFWIHEPKRRLISAAPFRDRVVHHALCNLIEPIFERTFVASSYANRRGKGTHRALRRVQQLCRRHGFVLQCDVRQFFPSLDHAVLRAELARRIDDADVLRLVDVILASGEGVSDEPLETRISGQPEVVFGVQDIRGTYEALKLKGVEFPHGLKEVHCSEVSTAFAGAFYDLDHNLLSIYGFVSK